MYNLMLLRHQKTIMKKDIWSLEQTKIREVLEKYIFSPINKPE